jgi:hypothetical protein
VAEQSGHFGVRLSQTRTFFIRIVKVLDGAGLSVIVSKQGLDYYSRHQQFRV